MSLERLHTLLVEASNALDDVRSECEFEVDDGDLLDLIDRHIDDALRLVQNAMEPPEPREPDGEELFRDHAAEARDAMVEARKLK